MPTLNTTLVSNAEIKDKIYYIWDDQVKGLALKVIPNGQKKYVIKYRTEMGGRGAFRRWYIFGDIQSLSCKEAREYAAKLFRMIHEGKDPQVDKNDRRNAETMREFWELFLTDYAAAKSKSTQYIKCQTSLWRHCIEPTFGNRKIIDVSNYDIFLAIRPISLGDNLYSVIKPSLSLRGKNSPIFS